MRTWSFGTSSGELMRVFRAGEKSSSMFREHSFVLCLVKYNTMFSNEQSNNR